MIHRSVLSGVHKQTKKKKTTSNNRQVCKSLPRLTMTQKELLPEITFKRLQEKSAWKKNTNK